MKMWNRAVHEPYVYCENWLIDGGFLYVSVNVTINGENLSDIPFKIKEAVFRAWVEAKGYLSTCVYDLEKDERTYTRIPYDVWKEKWLCLTQVERYLND